MRSFIVLMACSVGCGGSVDTTNPSSTAAAQGSTSATGGPTTIAATGTGSGGATGAGGGMPNGGAGGMGGTPMCPQAPLAVGVTQKSIDFGGLKREYEVQVPAKYDNKSAVPMVFDLHGFTSNKDQQKSMSGFSALAETEGFVVVRPNGHQASWNGGDYCCGAALQKGLDDVGLMRAIATEVKKQLCIDDKRVFATGLSNGGEMSHRLACDAADLFAMVAPVSYPLGYKPFEKCKPARPITIMHFHGSNDLIVPYNGGAFSPSVPESFAAWAKINGCSGKPAKTFEKGPSECNTYQTCKDGAEVTLCNLNGGHLLYSNNDNVAIAQLAWEQMKKHPLP
jgi:polyhydroxybutyrate depolymerase